MKTAFGGFMERQLRAIFAILMISYFGACAPVTFDTVPENKGDNVVVRCEGAECFYDITEEKTVGEGLVDILIVNDNSGSMSFEQTKMANAFSGFLTSINNLDYRIGMTTTDVADLRRKVGTVDNHGYNPSGPYNGYGALQDGKLIDFGSGQKYLSRTTHNKETLFNNTIRRDETSVCEASIARGDNPTQCPSGDERGIYAATLSVKNHVSAFARPTAHLAVIILSDEDERGVSKYNPCNYSGSADKSNCEGIKSGYPFETMDEPQNFVDTFRSLYPNKTVSVHSIIVRPGDISCRNAQTGQVPASMPVLGFEGYAYSKLSQLTGGIVGNICASNYTSQLQDIGYTIGEQVTSLPFRCRPVNDQFEVSYSGQPANPSTYSANFSTMVLNVSANLSPATKVTLKYTCSK